MTYETRLLKDMIYLTAPLHPAR